MSRILALFALCLSIALAQYTPPRNGGAATSVPASGVTPGTYPSGNYTYQGNLSVGSALPNLGTPSGAALLQNGRSPLGEVYAGNYGVIADGKYVADATTTNSSTTVTCPNSDCAFTAADVGKIVYGIYGANGGGTGMNGTLVLPQGTISSITNANSIVVSNAATASHTANVLLIWGTDQATALAAAFTAATSPTSGPCLAIRLPAGIILDSTAQFNNGSGACVGQTPNNRAGIAVIGSGMGATLIAVVPNFDFTTCTGPKHGCFGDNLNNIAGTGQGNSGGTYFQGWSIWGGGYSPTLTSGNSSTTCVFPNYNWAVVGNDNAEFLDFGVFGWGATTNCLGAAFVYGVPVYMHNVQFDGVGGSEQVLVYQGQFAWLTIDGNSYIGDANGIALDCEGCTLTTTGLLTGPGLSTATEVKVHSGTWTSTNDIIGFPANEGNHTQINIDNGAFVRLIGTSVYNSNAGSSAIGIDVQGANTKAILSNVYVKMTTATGYGVAISYFNGGAATLIDNGGNTIVATQPFINYLNAGTLVNNGMVAPTSQSGTSGTAACMMTQQGLLKTASCYLNGYAESGTAQTVTYANIGSAFLTVPTLTISGGSCGTFNPTTTATVLTLPANVAMTAETCNFILQGQ